MFDKKVNEKKLFQKKLKKVFLNIKPMEFKNLSSKDKNNTFKYSYEKDKFKKNYINVYMGKSVDKELSRNKYIKRKKFNVSLLGESEVGKTRIVNCYLGKEMEEINLSTIGIENYMDEKEFDGEIYKFKIYDTAGQERYKSISKSTIKITDGFLLVFSVNNKQSFKLINYWFDSIKDETETSKKVIILVGNKIDLDNRQVTNEEAVNYAKMKNILYLETSAKTGFGIKEVFKQVYQDIYNRFKIKTSKEDTSDNIVLKEIKLKIEENIKKTKAKNTQPNNQTNKKIQKKKKPKF